MVQESDYRHIEQTYDEGSKAYSDYFKTPHEFIEEERQQFIDRLPPGSKILDCGCGPGIDTERFSRLGYKVTAIDVSDRFVEFTKKRVPSAEVQKMDMRHLEFAEGSFDGVWSSFSFLHIREKDTERTLSGFKAVLRDAGLFFAGLHRGQTRTGLRDRSQEWNGSRTCKNGCKATLKASCEQPDLRSS